MSSEIVQWWVLPSLLLWWTCTWSLLKNWNSGLLYREKVCNGRTRSWAISTVWDHPLSSLWKWRRMEASPFSTPCSRGEMMAAWMSPSTGSLHTQTDTWTSGHTIHPMLREDWSGRASPPGRTTCRRKSATSAKFWSRTVTPVPSSAPHLCNLAEMWRSSRHHHWERAADAH